MMKDTTWKKNMQKWLDGDYDEQAKTYIKEQLKKNEEELIDAFYKELEFGTGGLRGLMGIGTNRINKYTVGMATQGFANYLKKEVEGAKSVVIAHDCRNNSRTFAEITASVMAANGIKAYLFESLRPTPELSFTIRRLQANGGVVCTASHNPKEYNGYKAYWNDGGQLIPPHDANVVAEVRKIAHVNDVKWEGNRELIVPLGKKADEAFIDALAKLSINKEIIKKQHDLKIVYTPIHGSGIMLVPEVLKRFGFTNVHIVEEQEVPNGNFPTVVYPNPEEAEAMSLGLKKAEEIDADLLLGTDPDADRVALGVKDNHGNWVLLNGNQTSVLLFNYLISNRKARGLNRPNDFICKTIVTSDMIDRFAEVQGITCMNVLTGFKWIAEKIRLNEGELNFICGGEESYGYLIGDQSRDKDAVGSVALICEMAAVAKEEGKTLFEQLISLYKEYGLYREKLVSITRKGIKGSQEIAAMMEGFRSDTPTVINGSKVIKIADYQTGKSKDLLSGETKDIDLPQSNVLQFFLEDGTKISARPSGTEPKIKFYFSVHTQLENEDDFDTQWAALDKKIDSLVAALDLEK